MASALSPASRFLPCLTSCPNFLHCWTIDVEVKPKITFLSSCFSSWYFVTAIVTLRQESILHVLRLWKGSVAPFEDLLYEYYFTIFLCLCTCVFVWSTHISGYKYMHVYLSVLLLWRDTITSTTHKIKNQTVAHLYFQRFGSFSSCVEHDRMQVDMMLEK